MIELKWHISIQFRHTGSCEKRLTGWMVLMQVANGSSHLSIQPGRGAAVRRGGADKGRAEAAEVLGADAGEAAVVGRCCCCCGCACCGPPPALEEEEEGTEECTQVQCEQAQEGHGPRGTGELCYLVDVL
eukprot:1160071-Pelagomonas_calceolata.AAC.17